MGSVLRILRNIATLSAPILFSLSSGWAADNFCSASYVTDLVKGDPPASYSSKYQAVNIFSFQFNGQCRVEAKSPWVEEISATLRNDPNRLILIDMVNEIALTPGPCRNLGTGQLLDQIFSDPALRAEHIRELVAISALGQSLEIDYERVLPASTTKLTQFMQELRAALPAEKSLAMVVQPKTQGGGEQGKTVDWRGVEPYVDYLRVMAYYYSYSGSAPGPVITYGKLGQLADYILSNPTQSIPLNKARIMLSLYGWDWPVSPAGPGQLIRYEEAMSIAQQHGVTPTRDPVQDTLHFQYTDNLGVVHEIWVEDHVGIQKRVQLLMDKDFPAIDLWHLNTGDTALWDWFTPKVRTDCPKLAVPPSPPANARLDQLSPVAVKIGSGDTTVTLTGSGFTSSDMVLVAGNPYFPFDIQPGSMKITIPAIRLAEAAVSPVTVVQNARLSNSTNFYHVGNPTISSFNPPEVVASTPTFTLAVHGGGFEPASFIRFNGRDIPAQFISPQEVRASITPDMVPRPATFLVGVVNPTSEARISRNFTVRPGGPAGAPALPAFSVGPNPWTACKNTGGIRFLNMSGGDVKIFSSAGHFIRRIEPTAGTGEWDLTNEDGESVASGLYFYIADTPEGSTERGTLAVIK